ncbi:ABATE domain-containing protein [Kitasatospora sp. NPDC002040]|uniref:CGNR zinc finger domain-containing protein n=1 Tax=Kitasatospora sp. NPDC002040 TaxID=3154661 RepID=UPI0033193396
MEEAMTGELLALDLINTRPASGDLLADVAGLRGWLRLQAGRGLVADPAGVGAAELAAVRGVRELAVAALGRARVGEPLPEPVLAGLNAALAAAPRSGGLVRDGAGVSFRHWREGSPEDRLAAELAFSVAELVADPVEVAAVRECAAEDCVLLFRPTNPRRQWCSAARCGNRARVARHYQRQKAAEA